MNLQALGENTLQHEVTNISRNGFWMLTAGKELFLSFEEFPWFINATVGKILHVEEPSAGHFYWPELDIDLTIDIIENPQKYPLKYQPPV